MKNVWDEFQLNKSKSNIESYELGVVWKKLHDRNLNGAHDAEADAVAQTDIFTHPLFVPFINRSESIQEIHMIFSKSDQNKYKKELEPSRPVHEPWQELTENNNIEWTPSAIDDYHGSQGGPLAGPTKEITDVARSAKDLISIFLFIVPFWFFEKVAWFTNKYCYEDWVVEKVQLDRDGNPKKKKIFKQVSATTGGVPTPGRRHRADRERKKYNITPGYMLVWFGLVMLQGAHFGADKRSSRKMWQKAPHGLAISYVRNSMSRDAYEFMRRNIHFADNSLRKEQYQVGYDPLFKVSYALDTMMNGIRSAWQPGKHIAIDESMIKYMGRAVSYVQYMKAKPIKHGIKVFVVCCALSAVMADFEIFVGKEAADKTADTSALGICDRLITRAGLTQRRGRILYTDNFYTSMKLAMHMFEKYGWTICGTIVPTEKKSRTDIDVPFLKLSNGARNGLERGWFREAAIELKTKSNKRYYIQCTTWRDKKQVMFLHNTEVGRSDGFSVMRHVKGQKRRQKMNGPRAQAEYIKFFNAVDKNDRDSADYSTTIRTNRYYLRILCWMYDRVVHTIYVVITFLAMSGIGREEWKKYRSKNGGRHDLQIDLAMSIINYGISLDWDGKSKERPSYMRQAAFVPCDCGACFFCINGLTNGIAHKHTGKRRSSEGGGGSATKKSRAVVECTMGKRVGLTLEDGSPMKWNDFCKKCLEKRDGKWKDKVKNCPTSKLGCAKCNEPICRECWKTYDHPKAQKSS